MADGSPQVSARAITLLSIAMDALGAKAVLLIPMVMTFLLFGWAMYSLTVQACVTCSLFAVLVFLPVLLRSPKNGP